MKTNVQQTSLLAYFDVKKVLGKKQMTLYQSMIENVFPITNGELSKKLNWPINTVTPRMKELRDMGIVRSYGFRPCRTTGRVCNMWEVVR
jgi:predicted transcriptional regulator